MNAPSTRNREATGGRSALLDDRPVVLEVRGLGKRYPGTVALRALDFTLREGEVSALLGKNGAGKSTFVEILSGTIEPDQGEVLLDGKTLSLRSPVQAHQAGIATVHQEFSHFPDLRVVENITLGRFARFGIVERRRQREVAADALSRLRVQIDLDARMVDLSPRDQQLVAIARAVSYQPRVLILDEPTSALSAGEIDHLLDLVSHLADEGVAVIYVSHRLDEIPRIADSVTVLRDGEHIATVQIADAPPQRIVEMMLGRALLRAPEPKACRTDVVAMSVRGLTAPPRVVDATFDLREGEILGLWGTPGSGRTELLRAIFGLDGPVGGTVAIHGVEMTGRDPRRMISHGVGLSPDDRKRNGVVLDLGVGENLVMASYPQVSRAGVLSRSRVQAIAAEQVARLAIKVSSIDSLVRQLSGGNQQKVVVGKWLAAGVRVLLMDEPTKGIDVEAKAALYVLLRELAAGGVAVLLAPTELEELFGTCDRILVMRRGQIVSDVAIEDANAAVLMAHAMGGQMQ